MLGDLVELVVVTPSGDRALSTSKLRGKYLAWLPTKRNFAIVVKTSKAVRGTLTAKDREVFRKFHKGDPKRAAPYEWPDKIGNLVKIGRLKSLTYVVPESIQSPQKRVPGQITRWVHEFGDHGERGHGEHDASGGYPIRLMPILAKDRRGNLFILRQPGNKYDVTEWIYW